MNQARRTPAVRLTGRRVRLADHCARTMITVGGAVVLAAMFGILVFLVFSAAPLFRGAKVLGPGPKATLDEPLELSFARVVNDADRALVVTTQGDFAEIRLTDGRIAARTSLVDGVQATAIAFEPGRWRVTIGTQDGSIVSATFQQKWFSVPDGAVPELSNLAMGDLMLLDTDERRAAVAQASRVNRELSPLSSVERTADGLVLWEPVIEPHAGFEPRRGEGAIVRIDSAGIGQQSRFIVLAREDGTAIFGSIRSTVRLDGSGLSERFVEYPFSFGDDGIPDWIFVQADGTGVLGVWRDGRFARFDARDLRAGVTLVERGRLVAPESQITSASMALGGLTLIVGEDSGYASAWLVAESSEATAPDRRALLQRWRERVVQGRVVSISPGDRDRSVVFVGSQGTMTLKHVTSRKRLAEFKVEPLPIMGAMTPSGNRVVWFDEAGGLDSRELEPGFPNVSIASLFGRVLYEGYSKREWVYQSTGDVQSEPKYSLVPLIFGTLKATVFAMLFAMPIGVLGAIYASEFMHRSVHRVVKPGIELMASLPSVVIGFVAAMVVAPFVRQALPGILVGLLVIPLIAVLGGMIWQTLPPQWTRRFGSRTKLGFVAAVLGVGVFVSAGAGPIVQDVLFAPNEDERRVMAGAFEPVSEEVAARLPRALDTMSVGDRARLRADGVFVIAGRAVQPLADASVTPFAGGSIEQWLDGNFGRAWPGWFVVMLLPSILLVLAFHSVVVARRWSALLENQPRLVAGMLELVRFVTSTGGIIACAALLATLLEAMGLDPRESIFGQFTPRNTLVVGIVMGFAIIPIIFTISEDALASVPKSLRSASLGSGATPWQTAIRVVLPVAGSGIFSACMIGLGRAVGETMIVLMATGNTPDMSWNIFAGFRTLAANIAVELPEAPKGGTHYRVLFVCGLILFLMTLIINTTAEFVRQHFRKKSAAL